MILGLRPSNSANLFASSLAFAKDKSFLISLLYTPLNDLIWALYLPKATSNASLISPRVALCLAAITAKSSKFSVPDLAACVKAFKLVATFWLSLPAFILAKRSSWEDLTIWLSTSRICRGSSFSSLYLLTPTIMSWPLSIRACFLAAASSIRNFGMPASMAFVMPPNSSTSSISAHALLAISLVRFST